MYFIVQVVPHWQHLPRILSFRTRGGPGREVIYWSRLLIPWKQGRYSFRIAMMSLLLTHVLSQSIYTFLLALSTQCDPHRQVQYLALVTFSAFEYHFGFGHFAICRFSKIWQWQVISNYQIVKYILISSDFHQLVKSWNYNYRFL